jgi:CheY-like chemotaxis protein/HPt (histidine-containing phosphotransfer) domain-containing protein
VAPLVGHVLLVEDNPINQGVAKAMLRKLGLSTGLAMNGAEAVEQVREQSFDLVLMDCQMPVMDGFEATAIIRRLPAGRGAALPIVALTANAMRGDEQRCLDAGMTAFLAKPYTLSELRALLARWLPPQQTDATAAASAVPVRPANSAPADASSAIDVAAIEALRELDEAGSMALAKELLQAFLDSSEHGVNQVAASIRSGDSAQLGRAAHTLKSSALNVGARELSGCYRELEKMGREGRIDAARALFDQTRLEHERAVARLREILLEVS